MAPHSNTLAWKIPWTEEPGRLQSTGSLRVRHDWATSLSLFTFMHWRRKWQPTSVFLPAESQGWGSLVGYYGVAQSQTRLKRLSSKEIIVVIQSLSPIWLFVTMNCSMSSFPVLHSLPEFAQTHVRWVGDAIQPPHPLSPPSPPALILSQHQGLF